ncbi:MAG: hypothetical protein JO100_14780 [Pseudonocardia sp.]|nr:hypothetical protein [Pseudonocardia sp.]
MISAEEYLEPSHATAFGSNGPDRDDLELESTRVGDTARFFDSPAQMREALLLSKRQSSMSRFTARWP